MIIAQFFRRKLSKIAENCDNNIDPLRTATRGQKIHICNTLVFLTVISVTVPHSFATGK
jgi:hypothetical protein